MFNATIAVLAIVGIIIILVGVLMLGGIKFRRTLKTVAKELRLEWEAGSAFGPGEISGSMRGLDISVFVDKKGAGTSFERMLTVVEVDIAPQIPLQFKLRKESVFNLIGHSVGLDDIEFDDPEFDPIYQVNCDNEPAIQALFHKDIREALVDAAEGAADIQISPKLFRWEGSGRIYDADLLSDVVDAAVDAVRMLQDYSRKLDA